MKADFTALSEKVAELITSLKAEKARCASHEAEIKELRAELGQLRDGPAPGVIAGLIGKIDDGLNWEAVAQAESPKAEAEIAEAIAV